MTLPTKPQVPLRQRVAKIAAMIINEFEGFKEKLPDGRVKSYWDKIGRVWTIANGLTGPDIGKDTIWTMEQCEDRFQQALLSFVDGTLSMVHIGLLDAQYAALVSFAFNVGLDDDTDEVPEGLGDSTLLKLVNAGRFALVSVEWVKWVNGFDPDTGKKGKIRGLQRRRARELQIFEQGHL